MIANGGGCSSIMIVNGGGCSSLFFDYTLREAAPTRDFIGSLLDP